jgi:hypothetical protein
MTNRACGGRPGMAGGLAEKSATARCTRGPPMSASLGYRGDELRHGSVARVYGGWARLPMGISLPGRLRRRA